MYVYNNSYFVIFLSYSYTIYSNFYDMDFLTIIIPIDTSLQTEYNWQNEGYVCITEWVYITTIA